MDINKVIEDLRSLEQEHYECEDCWYSCPKSGECCNEYEEDICTCGADIRNEKIEEIVTELEIYFRIK